MFLTAHLILLPSINFHGMLQILTVLCETFDRLLPPQVSSPLQASCSCLVPDATLCVTNQPTATPTSDMTLSYGRRICAVQEEAALSSMYPSSCLQLALHLQLLFRVPLICPLPASMSLLLSFPSCFSLWHHSLNS